MIAAVLHDGEALPRAHPAAAPQPLTQPDHPRALAVSLRAPAAPRGA